MRVSSNPELSGISAPQKERVAVPPKRDICAQDRNPRFVAGVSVPGLRLGEDRLGAAQQRDQDQWPVLLEIEAMKGDLNGS
jgi:hypothetical protein